LPNLDRFFKDYLTADLIPEVIWVTGWNKMVPGRVREGVTRFVRKGCGR